MSKSEARATAKANALRARAPLPRGGPELVSKALDESLVHSGVGRLVLTSYVYRPTIANVIETATDVARVGPNIM